LVKRTNKLIDDTFPWDLAKDDSKKDVLESVMYHLLEGIRLITIMYQPFLLETTPKVFHSLNVEEGYQGFDAYKFGYKTDYQVVKKFKHLFPRLDVEKEAQKIKEMMDENKPKEKEKKTFKLKPEIEYDDFMKLDLVCGHINDAKQHPNADKLLVFDVDTGDRVRTIVSGIAKYYQPEDLKGKNVMVVINLKPVKLRGIMSEGMILSGEKENGDLRVVVLDEALNPGDKIS
jgi:methionyl-tRNA synthetase